MYTYKYGFDPHCVNYIFVFTVLNSFLLLFLQANQETGAHMEGSGS